jgi:hypothetical protein
MQIVVTSKLSVSDWANLSTVKLRFLECLDQEFKFMDIEAGVLPEVKATVDLSRVPEHFICDVREFIDENQGNSVIRGQAVERLTPAEFLSFWLQWQGLIGYSSDVVELMEALGWRRAE